MAVKAIDKHHESGPQKPTGKGFFWSPEDAHGSLPKHDCQTPIQKRRGIKSLDCETHARILRKQLQRLLETGELDKLSRTVKEGAPRPISSKSQSQENAIRNESQQCVRELPPSMSILKDQRPPPIPMEGPRINPNHPAVPPSYMGLSNSDPERIDPHHIPLFEPTVIQKLAEQRAREPVSLHVYAAAYDKIVGLGVQPPSRAHLR